jgi:GAF domain-containing protein
MESVVADHGSRFEFQHRLADGTVRDVEVSASLILLGEKPVLHSIIFDNTERTYVQKALERERKAFKIIAESASLSEGRGISAFCHQILAGFVSTLDFDFGIIRLYDEKKKTLYPAASTGIPVDIMSTVLPQHIDDAFYLAAHVARTREAIFAPNLSRHKIFHTHRARLDELGAQSVISWPIIDSRQALLGVIQLLAFNAKEIPERDRVFFETVAGMFSIALERAHAVEALESSHERLSATLNALPDIMFEVDMQGTIHEYRSQATAELYTPPEMFLGKSLSDVMPPPVVHIIKEALSEAEEKGSHRGKTVMS